jgi:hypothetical protein
VTGSVLNTLLGIAEGASRLSERAGGGGRLWSRVASKGGREVRSLMIDLVELVPGRPEIDAQARRLLLIFETRLERGEGELTRRGWCGDAMPRAGSSITSTWARRD